MTASEFTFYQQSPLGWLQISGSETGISRISFCEEIPEDSSATALPACIKLAATQLTEYFAGRRTYFELPLAPNGTGFQQKVWQQLGEIPFGKTESYLSMARKLGEATYTRAIGSANGRNPLAIVVPCHRVIGADGSLTGYAGGLWRKKWLLEFESQTRQTELFSP